MRAIILNGALDGDDGLAPIAQALDAALAVRGWAVERIALRDKRIVYCKGCFDCWVKTPGVCPTRDDASSVTRAIARSDLVVLLSPVTFGGYSSEIKKVLDRAIGLVSPMFTRIGGEVHHRARYARYPALLAVGVTTDANAEEERIFSTLVARNALNLHAPAYAAGFVSRDDAPGRIREIVAQLVSRLAKPCKGVA